MEDFWEFFFRLGLSGYVAIPFLLIAALFAFRLLKIIFMPKIWLKKDYKIGRVARDKNEKSILRMFDWF